MAGRRRRKNSPNLSSPSPNVRRDKISRSGEPLTLIFLGGCWGILQYSLKYQITTPGNELDAHFISGGCPESISEHPGSVSEHPGSVFSSWPWAAGNIIIVRCVFRKNRPPIGPLEFCPRANSYFRWSSTYHISQKKFGLETGFCLIFSISGQQQFSDLRK